MRRRKRSRASRVFPRLRGGRVLARGRPPSPAGMAEEAPGRGLLGASGGYCGLVPPLVLALVSVEAEAAWWWWCLRWWVVVVVEAPEPDLAVALPASAPAPAPTTAPTGPATTAPATPPTAAPFSVPEGAATA